MQKKKKKVKKPKKAKVKIKNKLKGKVEAKVQDRKTAAPGSEEKPEIKKIKNPKNFLIGLTSQLIFLPIVALIIVFVWPLQPELAIGLMLIAAAPGGVTSNILTSFAKGDVALSISMTDVMSLLSVVSVPIVLGISMGYISDTTLGSISLTGIAISMFLIVTLPV